MAGTVRVEQAGWWGGIVSLLLIGAGFFAIDAGGTNGPDAPVDLLVNDIVSMEGRIVVGSIVGAIGAIILIWFASALRLRLARDGELGSMIGLAAYGSALLMSVGALLHASFRLAMTSVGSLILAEAMRPLAILGAHTFDVFAWGMIALAVAVIVAAFAVDLVPRSLAAIGAFICVASFALAPTGHGGAVLALLPWLMGVCAVLIYRWNNPITLPSGSLK
jgi:hypothetical protein